jgi:hypothetical protein
MGALCERTRARVGKQPIANPAALPLREAGQIMAALLTTPTRSPRTMPNPANAAKKYASKWFRVATEGATVDGRKISADHLRQMAKNFDPIKVYGARVWLEHLRGTLPDSMFRALGDVTAVKAEEQDGKLRLFAQIDPTPELLEINKKRQKIYTSIEINPSFADTGEAYMVGLAVTDSPASLGTEELKFAVGARRPDDLKNHLFSAAEETAIEFAEVTDPAPVDQTGPLVAAFTKVLQAFGVKPAEEKPAPVVTPPAGSLDHAAVAGALAGLQTAFTDSAKATQAAVDKLSTDLKAQADKVTALGAQLAKLDGTPDPEQQHRTRNLGAPGSAKTDC